DEDEGVRVELGHGAVDGRDDVDLALTVGLDGDAGADDRSREDGVGDVGHRHDGAGDGCEDPQAHRRSSMSSTMLSASGPTTTCTAVPCWTTPKAPAARSAASSTLLESS